MLQHGASRLESRLVPPSPHCPLSSPWRLAWPPSVSAACRPRPPPFALPLNATPPLPRVQLASMEERIASSPRARRALDAARLARSRATGKPMTWSAVAAHPSGAQRALPMFSRALTFRDSLEDEVSACYHSAHAHACGRAQLVATLIVRVTVSASFGIIALFIFLPIRALPAPQSARLSPHSHRRRGARRRCGKQASTPCPYS